MRILIAGIVGGLVAFFCGAFNHMVLEWGGRAFSPLKDEAKIKAFFKEENYPAGIYQLPDMPRGPAKERTTEVMEKLNEEYKQGPAVLFIVHPTGQDMMGPGTLGMELLSNIGCALIVSWIASQCRPGYLNRFLVVMLAGVFGWLSISESYHIWYRFPWEFIRDELYGALSEWSIAGLFITMIIGQGVTRAKDPLELPNPI
jgi:hypothetical protein